MWRLSFPPALLLQRRKSLLRVLSDGWSFSLLGGYLSQEVSAVWSLSDSTYEQEPHSWYEGKPSRFGLPAIGVWGATTRRPLVLVLDTSPATSARSSTMRCEHIRLGRG